MTSCSLSEQVTLDFMDKKYKRKRGTCERWDVTWLLTTSPVPPDSLQDRFGALPNTWNTTLEDVRSPTRPAGVRAAVLVFETQTRSSYVNP